MALFLSPLFPRGQLSTILCFPATLILALFAILPFSSSSTGRLTLSAPLEPVSPCPPPKCGALSNISFPFSVVGSNTSTSTCGLPEFQVNCNESHVTWSPEPASVPGLSITNITSNHMTSGTLIVVAGPPAVSPPIDACSPLQQEKLLPNVSSFSLPLGLQFSLFGNTILLTNCSESSTQHLQPNETVDGFSFSSPKCLAYHSVCSNQSSDVTYKVPCLEAISEEANITFMKDRFGCLYNITLYELPKAENRVLTLQISWSISQSYYDCKACEGSNGTCSLNNITSSFQCLCPGHPDELPSTNVCESIGKTQCNGLSCGSNVDILIGAAGGIAIIIVIGVIFSVYFYQRRRARLIQGGSSQPLVLGESLTSKEQVKRILAREDGVFPECITRFSYMELFAATNGFAENKVLGGGGFGKVYEGTLICSGEKVAIKRLNSDNARRFEQFLNELRILSSLHHPNIVRLHGFCCDNLSELLLVYQFACNGTLADNLHGITRKACLLWETRMSIASEAAAALAYMHQQDPPILHRDVKSSNILLGEKFHVKLADFGLSRKVYALRSTALASTTLQGTPGYVDPQYQECYRLTDKSDVYSFGVVLMELISGKVPIDTTRPKQNDHINLSSLAVAKIQAGALNELIDPILLEQFSGSIDRLQVMVARVAEIAFLCLAPLQDDRPTMSSVARTLYDIATDSSSDADVPSHSNNNAAAPTSQVLSA